MRIVILFFILNCTALLGQNVSGVVISEKDKSPVGFVNIGIAGKNIGTVSDFNGKFNLLLDAQFDNDTLLFSCIGYNPFSIKISELKKDNNKNIFLKEKAYEMKEIVIRPKNFKQRTLGVTSHSKMVEAGFKDNLLGYECGILMETKKSAELERVNINIAQCTYDSIFYRLNIYRVRGKMNFENILTTPIYINISKDQVKEKITIDLQSQNIIVDGDFLVTLENVKNLGNGNLYFCSGIMDKTYFRKTSQAVWETIPVGISISVDAKVEK